MKRIVYIFLLIVGVFYSSMAQDSLRTPHGGQLKATGYYHVEVVECYQFLEIYLYEADMYPIRNYGFSGMVDFYYPDNTCSTSKLYPYGVDGFTAEVTRQCYMSCEVELKNLGTSVKVVFTGFGENNDDCKRPDKDQVQN